MRMQIVSDLHLEFFDFDVSEKILNKVIKQTDASILIIAGDLHIGALNIINALNDIKTYYNYEHIFYVPGNHDFYGSSYGKEEKLFTRYTKELFDMNIHVMIDNIYILNNIMFTGIIGWTNNQIPNFRYNDFNEISDFQFHHNTWHNSSLRLMDYIINNSNKYKKVMITHFLPSIESVNEKFTGNKMNEFFHNNFEKFIEMYNAKYWIHGHSHDSVNYISKYNNFTNVICNPFGYYNYQINKNYLSDLVIDI